MIAASLIDLLAPEQQVVLAYAAWGSLLLGAALCACGVTFARATVALILGTAVMLFALWFPSKIGMNGSPYVAGAIGFAVGAIVGGWGFRWVQAATLAACLGLAVAGLYYQWHVRNPPSAQPVSASRSADSMMVPIYSAAKPGVSGALEAITRQITSIPRIHVQRMAIAGLGSALIAVLFAMGFPRATTTLITAVMGALGVMAGVYCLVHIYKPQLSDYLPSGTAQSYAAMAVLIVMGLAIQYRFFWRLPDKSPERAKPNA